jgi:hypothetical protein
VGLIGEGKAGPRYRDRGREGETHGDTEKYREMQRDAERYRDRGREGETHGDTWRYREMQRDAETQGHIARERYNNIITN